MSVAKPCAKCAARRSHSHSHWAVPVLIGLLLEAEGMRRQRYDHTLSQTTRFVFQTDKKMGKVAFLAAWSLLSLWYPKHILKGKYTK